MSSSNYVTPGSGSFQDSAGNIYSIDSTGNADENGTAIAGGANTAALEYYNGAVYGEDASSLQWYTWNQTTWSPAAAPPSATTGSSSGSTTSSGSSASGSSTSSPPSSTSSTGTFSVSNGQIIGPNGQAFVARGINIYADLLVGSGASNTASQITSTFPGVNFVRLNVFDTNTDSAAALQPIVQQLTNQGVVVEIEDHNYPTVLSGSNLSAAANWYSSLASAFKGNANVWFGTQNEPDLSQGASGVDTEISTIYNAIRSTGNNTMIMVNPAGGTSVSGLDPSTFSGMTNVAWDGHFYNWESNNSTSVSGNQSALNNLVSGLQSFTTDANGTIPVVIGEYGDASGANGSVYDPGGMQVVQAVEQSGIGSAAWAWTSGDPSFPLLLNDGYGNPSSGLTQFGQSVEQYISASASSSASTGSPSNTGTTTPSGATSSGTGTSGSGSSGSGWSGSDPTATGGTTTQMPTYITPGSGSFQDSAGNTYAIDASGNADENGSPIPDGSGTAAMEYYNNTVYGQDATTQQWYTWDQTTWASSAAPPAASDPGSSGTTPSGSTSSDSSTSGSGSNAGGSTGTTPQTTLYITPGSGSFQDAAGNTYTIDTSGNADENNAAIPDGSDTAAMEYYNNTVYGQDANSQQWYTWDQSTWTASAAPPQASGTTSGTTTTTPTTSSGETISWNGNDETVQVTQGNTTITTGAGNDTISFAGSGDVVNAGAGSNTLYDSGSSSTIVLPAASTGNDTIHGNVLQNGDTFDLRQLMAATSWNGSQNTLRDFLKMGTSGNNANAVLYARDTASGSFSAVATFENTGPVALSKLLAHATV